MGEKLRKIYFYETLNEDPENLLLFIPKSSLSA